MHRKDGVWKEGVWVVTVRGSHLERIYDHLCLSKQRLERERTGGRRPCRVTPGPQSPEVTEIIVVELAKR